MGNKFKMKITFDEEPIAKVRGNDFNDLEKSFKELKKKFKGGR